MTKFCILAVLLFPSTQSAPFVPSPAFCCVENGLQLLLRLFKGEMDLFVLQVRFISFFSFFFQLVCRECFFFHFSDNAIVRGRRKPLLRYPLFNNSPFFMFILWLSQQLLRSWALSSPTIHCRTALVWHSSPFFFFFPHSSVWAGQSRPKSWRQ